MLKTLLVDDEEAILRLLGDILGLQGFAISTASSARDAIAALAREPFDLVVTDLRMESPTAGFDVVEAAGQVTPRPLVVILSAFPVTVAEWKSAGADACYQKDSDIFGLSRRLKDLFESERSSRQ